MTSMLRAALEYVERGFAVLPLRPGTKVPLTAHGVDDATGDLAQVEAWWSECPQANVGYATGPSGLFVVDADSGKPEVTPEEQRAIAEFVTGHGLAGAPVIVKTPSGGRHYVYRCPGDRAFPTLKAPFGVAFVELRCGTGYCVAPPSTTDVGEYELTEGSSFDELTEPPASLLALLDGRGDQPERSSLVADPVTDSAFPTAKHEALLANRQDYAASWEHKRTDLKDQSLSAYDLSLCSIASRCGWTPDELAALVREHRDRRSVTDEDRAKGRRADYLKRTIGRALADVDKEREQVTAAETLEAAASGGDTPRDEVIRALATRFGIALTNVERITGKVPLLRFHVGGRVVEVPQGSCIEQRQWRKAIFSGANVPPRQIGPKETPGWDHYLAIIAGVAAELDAGEEAALDGSTWSLVRGFVESRVLQECEPGTVIERQTDPVLRDGFVWFRSQDLVRYACTIGGVRVERTELLQRLRAIGGQEKVMKCLHRRDRDKGTSTRFWGLPQGDVLGEADEDG